MVTLQAKIKQLYLGLLLLALIPTAAFCLSPPSVANPCKTIQCSRFHHWGFSPELAKNADQIKKIMDLTKIDIKTHNVKSFFGALNSNWSPHNNDSEFSVHKFKIQSATIQLGMNVEFNEVPDYTPKEKPKLYIIILGSNPKQLCSTLSELIQFRHEISQTILIGSATPTYEAADYLNCSALNPLQKEELLIMSEKETGKLMSDADIMPVYFNDFRLNASYPLIQNSGEELDAVFNNNKSLLAYLNANAPMARFESSVIIASPQPYLSETMAILKKKLPKTTIYRFSTVGDFNIYESLNALRSWLQTDYSLNQ